MTNKHTDIATLWLTRPKGQVSEKVNFLYFLAVQESQNLESLAVTSAKLKVQTGLKLGAETLRN